MANLTETVPADTMTEADKKRKGWRVLLFGVLSNFSIGILYTWSNLKDILEYRSVRYAEGITKAADAADRLYKEVASLKDYLRCHPEMDARLNRGTH